MYEYACVPAAVAAAAPDECDVPEWEEWSWKQARCTSILQFSRFLAH